MKRLVIFILILNVFAVSAQQHNIIPAPLEITCSEDRFPLNSNTKIYVANKSLESSADYYIDYVKKYCGITIAKTKAVKDATILLSVPQTKMKVDNDEAYSLNVTGKKVTLKGASARGIFWGVQTLIQLTAIDVMGNKVGSTFINGADIKDKPRFGYRGMHLDVARHFFTVEEVKEYIDLLALHKINTFHWHLTDDQGWRIEIKKYPLLTSVGGWRNGTIIGRYPGKGNTNQRYGGYYTQAQIKEVVAYAAKRYINIIPEIEMPGHASAAIAAYNYLSCFPERNTKIPFQTIWSGDSTGKQVQQTWGVFDDVFCAGKESTFEFMQNVLAEIMQLFPSTYIHIGGDECPKTHWKQCPNCQQRMKDNKLKDEHELQSWFIQRIEKFVNNKGKKIIGWDEILEGGLAPNATVMSWRGEKGGIEAAKQKHDVVMSPGSPLYFDHKQSKNEDSVTFGGYNPIENVYAYNPVPAILTADEAKHILGAQANVWTEYITNKRKLEYTILPRMAALSEVLWSDTSRKDYNSFINRLNYFGLLYGTMKLNTNREHLLMKDSISPAENKSGVLWTIYPKTNNNPISIVRPDSFYVERVVTSFDPVTGDSYIDTFKGYSKYSIYSKPIVVLKSGKYEAERTIGDLGGGRSLSDEIVRVFNINKATGKNVTLSKPQSSYYAGVGGAFGLVNGITTDKGSDGSEWLGWKTDSLDIIIDLNKTDTISKISLHYLAQEASGMYEPLYNGISISNDGNSFNKVIGDTKIAYSRNDGLYMIIPERKQITRYIKISLKPQKDKWLMLDEIMVE